MRNSYPNTATTPKLASWNCTGFEFNSALIPNAWRSMSSLNNKTNYVYHFADIEPERPDCVSIDSSASCLN